MIVDCWEVVCESEDETCESFSVFVCLLASHYRSFSVARSRVDLVDFDRI